MRKVTALSVVSSGTFTADNRGSEISVFAAKGLTIAIGDVVIIDQIDNTGEWWAIAVGPATTPTTPIDRPKPPNKPTNGTLVVSPVETRTYRGGWRTDNTDLYQGVWGGSTFGNNTGCAFYGSKPRSIPGATVTSATIKVRRKSSGGITAAQVTTLWLVTQSTRPSGAPTRGSSTAGPTLKWGQATTFAIPDSWAQAMVDGTAGGLAIFQADEDPYVIWDGKSAWSESMKLTINYQR
jgi:hypothetical protein